MQNANRYCVFKYRPTNHRSPPQPQVPESLAHRRADVVKRLTSLTTQVKAITDFLSNEEAVNFLKQDKTQNMAFLQREYSIGPEQIDALYHYAKLNFECGNYSVAGESLYHYRSLSTHPERTISALWGKVAADILLQDYTTAMDDLTKLKETLDLDTFAPVARQLQQKAWLMHWALFVFFNHENGMNALIDLFMQDRYITAIQLNCQHLLRYLAVAVVVNRRRRNVLKDLVRVIAQEQYEYSDPVTEFLRCLFVEYDFDGAQEQLAKCDALLASDYFLVAARESFMEAARQFLFETYCRIHQAIDIKSLAVRLGMDEAATEKWIVNLISNARLNAKIDSQAGTVVMQTGTLSPYEQLLERARGMSLRTFSLANTVTGMLKSS
jgi:translation initiation factor 3 subunit E